MAVYQEVKAGRKLFGKLDFQGDLLAEFTEICQREDVRLGRISAIGAVTQARLGFYNQTTRQYQTLTVDHAMEIASLLGNVSVKDGLPFVHIHLSLANEHGQTFSGHLLAGTHAFACEFVIEEYLGEELTRDRDEQTGLTLWKM